VYQDVFINHWTKSQQGEQVYPRNKQNVNSSAYTVAQLRTIWNEQSNVMKSLCSM